MERAAFGVELMHTFDGGRWLWNHEASWLEYIPFNCKMPTITEQLRPQDNAMFEAAMVCCRCEERRIYLVKKVKEAD